MAMTLVATAEPDYKFNEKGILSNTRKSKESSSVLNRTQTDTSRNMPQFIPEDLVSVMNDEGIITLIIDNEYGTMKVSLVHAREEVRRVVGMYKKALSFFVSFGSIGVGAFSSFVVLGLLGVISPFVAIMGSFFTGILTAGLFVDFKKWERDYV